MGPWANLVLHTTGKGIASIREGAGTPLVPADIKTKIPAEEIGPHEMGI